MSCKIYKLLFWLIPLKRWQAFIIQYHFYKCNACRKESGVEDNFNQIPISPRNCQNLPSIWPHLKKQILQAEEKKARKKSFIFPHKWQWALTVLGLFCLILFLPYLWKKNKNFSITHKTASIKKGPQIILKTVKMGNRPAKTYFFQSSHPDRLIVWVQKTIRRKQ